MQKCKEKYMKLIVEKSSWSGWSRDYKPNIEVVEFDDLRNMFHLETILKTVIAHTSGSVEYNNEIVPVSKVEIEFFSFIVMELGEDYIVIKTSEPMSSNDDGSIDLHTKVTVFKIEKGKKLKLTTPTMDSGNIYTFELKD